MSEPKIILEQLISLQDEGEQRAYVERHRAAITAETFQKWKQQVEDAAKADRPNALTWADLVVQIGEWLGDDHLRAVSYWIKGNALFLLTQPEEALTWFEQAEAIYRELGNLLELARMGVGKLAALDRLGRYEEAIAFGEQEVLPVLASSQDDQDRRHAANAAGNLGIAYEHLGRYEEALSSYESKKRWWQDQEGELALVQQARAGVNIGVALTLLGLYAEAQKAFESARQVLADPARIEQHRPDIARIDMDLAWLQARRGADPAAVRTAFAQARQSRAAIAAESADLVLLDLFEAEWQMQQATDCPAEMEQILTRLQGECLRLGLGFETHLSTLLLARCALLRKEYNQAARLYQTLLDEAQTQGEPELVYLAYHGLGQVWEQQGDESAARAAYESALDVIEGVQRRLQTDEFRAGFLEDKLTVYQDLALLLLRQGEHEEALETVERAKARTLLDLLLSKMDQIPLRPDEMDAETQSLVDRLQGLRRELARRERARQEQTEQVERERGVMLELAPRSNADLQQMEREIVSLVRQIAQRAPRFASLQTVLPFPLPEIVSHLPPRTLLLAYALLRDAVWVFPVDHSGLVGSPRCLGPAPDWETVYQDLLRLQNIAGRPPQFADQHATQFTAAVQKPLARWYQQLIAPLDDLLTGYEHLMIVPDGILHHLPFHAFYDAPQQRYLVETHRLTYAPSMRVWALAQQSQIPLQDRALTLAISAKSGLPFTLDEAASVAASFPNLALYTNELASRNRLSAEEASHADVIHLAAHGVFRPDVPLLSYIELNDDRLDAFDAYNLSLNASLVVLSACETGRGRLTGNELLGLTRGFLYAGARALLVSQWQVDDQATAELIAAFYGELRNGATLSEALQKAQRHLLHQASSSIPRWRHPHYWASFILVGADGTVGAAGAGRRLLRQAMHLTQTLLDRASSLDDAQRRAVREEAQGLQERWNRARTEAEYVQVAEALLALANRVIPDAARELRLADLPPAPARARSWQQQKHLALSVYRGEGGILISLSGRKRPEPAEEVIPINNIPSDDLTRSTEEMHEMLDKLVQLTGLKKENQHD